IMKSIMRFAVFALSCAAVLNQPAFAQISSELSNSLITFSYSPPKSAKYLPMMDRLRSFRIMEQLSEFLSSLLLPAQLLLEIKECGFANAQFTIIRQADPAWRIQLCYEFVEAIERLGPKQGEQSQFTYEDIVVGSLVGVLLHEGGHAVFNMLNVPVFGREE